MDPGLIDLFVDGTENALPEGERLDAAGLGEGSVVFMLQRAGWCWEECGAQIMLMGEGRLVAAKAHWEAQLVTGGVVMTEGRHYWEVELTWAGLCSAMLGAVRPGLDHHTYQ